MVEHNRFFVFMNLRSFLTLFILTHSFLDARLGIDFNRDIRPLLSDRCFACHGPDSHDRKASFALTVQMEMMVHTVHMTASLQSSPDPKRQRVMVSHYNR